MTRKRRDFQNLRARKVLKEVRSLFRRERRAMNVHDLAEQLHMTPRQAREYLNYMHMVTGELFIQGYVESCAIRGRKLPCYRMKRTGKEVDAIKWWLSDHESNGGLNE